MRLSLHRDLGFWRMSGLLGIHIDVLRQAVLDASMTDCAEGRARVYPKPVSDKDAAREAEFVEDWKEFVSDELENQFAGDVGVFMTDIDAAEDLRDAKGGKSPQHRIDVPLDHSWAWYSTLNQARLMLDQKFRLHTPETAELFANEPRQKVSEAEAAAHMELVMALERYEFFSAIQGWMVAHVL